MRTTVTLETDVAVRLERERRKRGVPFKEIVNRALRAGLDNLDAPQRRQEPFRTGLLTIGVCCECENDCDCAMGETCVAPEVDLMSGLVAGSCV